MSRTQQYIACTLPALAVLGKPNINVSEEHVIQGTTPKSNCTLVHSASLPACGHSLTGLTPVPEDSHAGQPDFSGHYASLDPSEGAEDTPTGTPNPSGGGGPPGGAPPPPGGGGPPDDGLHLNLNPGLNPDPKGGDGGRPPDDNGDHSSDDDENKALNQSYKDNLTIIAKHVVDKDGGNIKVRVPDTFNGSDPDKLRDFIFGCRLTSEATNKPLEAVMSLS
ncbi:hypothetical protein M422DRAFT_263500 [Sphaerobolus stellatus SS14]|uniref:Uncharacterized protein n=1 Tax=Sphaerobolus stellatus (strain SS14) TaxID=990650 RepID=A0A0C9UYK5_SPHS4|nr:hypothetical protein M422DRAFT_263500 [Sphaerobolus stellatus SS14]